ncbi:hypothetical protein [Nesterenkonia marinintestina]|uniref:hypothetical protein n=1 Tax=Nesterenkonia marinintestina TaxID=2979865 RepID=UPI0021BF6875|nr:hypothetical protein [Nesterenkonia sp. GX14115]
MRSPDETLESQVLAASDKPLSVSMMSIPAEAEGGTVHWIGRLALIEAHSKRLLACDYQAHESSLGAFIVKDKVLTGELLTLNSVPTPKTFLVDSAEKAILAADAIGGPVTIKPRSGHQSKGVSTGLIGEEEIRQGFTFAQSHGSQIIVQEHIEVEEELRVMASPDQAVAVVGRVAPHVIGDGASTVKQLIDDKNLQRRLNPALRNLPMPVDSLTDRYLEKQELSLESVPGMGDHIEIRNVAGLSAGADPYQALAGTGPDIKFTAASAIAAIPGLEWGGVDIIVEKGTGNPYVIEINTQAHYGGAVFPSYGQPVDVGSEVWRLRHAAALPTVNSEPDTAEPSYGRELLWHDTGETFDSEELSFSRLFTESLIRQGYAIQQRNRRVLQVRAPHGQETWVTADGRTSADRSLVQKVMQRHEWVAGLLDVAQVPRPRSEVITSARQLKRFVKGRVNSVSLIPVSALWNGPEKQVLTEEQALETAPLPGKMWVQARPRGRRLRVLATQHRAWVVTVPSDSRPLEVEHLREASRLAVKAVRAIPELRWAAVDLVVRRSRLQQGRPGGILVESMTCNPAYSTEVRIIAGDFDAFSRAVIGPVNDDRASTKSADCILDPMGHH